jgi:hypothetical protein
MAILSLGPSCPATAGLQPVAVPGIVASDWVDFEMQKLYQVNTEAATLIPFVGIRGSSSGRSQALEVISLSKFDAALGDLNSVRIDILTAASIRHSHLGVCESLFLVTCQFELDTHTTNVFSVDIAGINDGVIGPPGQPDGIIPVPGDVSTTRSFDSGLASVIAGGNSRSTGFAFDLQALADDDQLFKFIGAGDDFDLLFSLLSATTDQLECRFAVLAACQTGTQITSFWDISARAVYFFTPLVAPPAGVPEPPVLALLGLGILGIFVRRQFKAA